MKFAVIYYYDLTDEDIDEIKDEFTPDNHFEAPDRFDLEQYLIEYTSSMSCESSELNFYDEDELNALHQEIKHNFDNTTKQQLKQKILQLKNELKTAQKELHDLGE